MISFPKWVVYIAGPFRAANRWEEWQNINRACELALEAWSLPGVAVICPHANTFPFQGALPDEAWLEGDLELILRSDVVLTTPDWEKSRGATHEVAFARQNVIMVVHSIADLREWLNARHEEWFDEQEN